MEKKKAVLNAGVVRPKGNGINDSNERWLWVYAVSFWQILSITKVRPITLLSLLYIFLKTVIITTALLVSFVLKNV